MLLIKTVLCKSGEKYRRDFIALAALWKPNPAGVSDILHSSMKQLSLKQVRRSLYRSILSIFQLNYMSHRHRLNRRYRYSSLFCNSDNFYALDNVIYNYICT